MRLSYSRHFSPPHTSALKNLEMTSKSPGDHTFSGKGTDKVHYGGYTSTPRVQGQNMHVHVP